MTTMFPPCMACPAGTTTKGLATSPADCVREWLPEVVWVVPAHLLFHALSNFPPWL